VRTRAPEAFGESTRLPVSENVPRPARPPRVDSVSSEPSRHPRPSEGAPYDPLRLCIYTTIGLIAWLITPPLTVAIFGTMGVVGYVRARRGGLVSTRCLLGDTRLVVAYLAVAALGGFTWTIWRLVG
jgi:hypothetical protein